MKINHYFPLLLLQILDRISLQYATNEKRINASHERYEKRTIHESNAQYTNERNETNELYGKCKWANKRYTKRTHDTWMNESLERNHILSNDKRSWFYKVQYSIVLLFEWLLCKLMWLTNLIFYAQLIYINDKLVGKVIG